jgi:hypothetical protein
MATMNMKIVPLEVPDNVRIVRESGKRQDGFLPLATVPLRDLDIETLDELVNEFRFNLLEKADKKCSTFVSSSDKQLLAHFYDAAIKLQQEYQNNRVSTASTVALDNFAEASLKINSLMAKIKIYG